MSAVHADVKLIKADSSTDAFSFDRGQVTAASDKAVTLKRADGPSVTKTISSRHEAPRQAGRRRSCHRHLEGLSGSRILAAGPKA